MPYVKRTRRSKRGSRRPRNRGKSSRTHRTIGSFSKAPMPNKFATKLRYCENNIIQPGLGGIPGVRIVSANGVYDPNITGTGHQPRGFDQLMSMYDHVVVIGAKLTVTFSTIYTQAYPAMVIGISLKDSATIYTDSNDYMEGRNLISRTIPGTSTTSNTSISTLSKTFSCKKFLGRSKPLADPQLKNDVASNPTEQAYFHIWAYPLDNSTDTLDIRVNMRIDYLCVFIEPRQPSQS